MSARKSAFVLCVLLALSSGAAPLPEREPLPRRAPARDPAVAWQSCPTGIELDQRLQRLHQFVQERERSRFRAAAPAVRIDKGVYIMEIDDTVAPFDRPFDLHDSSLDLTRTSATAFTVQKTALNYDLDVGSLRRALSGYTTEAYHISSFVFPFYGSSVSDLVITSNKGIFLGTPPLSQFDQFSALEALSQRVPVIAPLLNTTNQPNGYYNLYVKETAAALTLTWRSRSTTSTNEDIQVVLFSSGNIRFSYRTVTNISHGTVIVTSGTESWYGSTTSIGSFTDSTTDVNAALPVSIKDMLEIESVQVQRVSNSDLIEFVITTKATINPAVLAAGQYLLYQVYPGNSSAERSANSLYARLEPAQTRYQPGGWSYTTNSPAVTVSGRTLTLRVLDGQMTFATRPITVNVYGDYYSPSYVAGDTAQGLSVPMTAGSQLGATDLSALTSAASIAGKPIVESFTLPMLDPLAVWDRLKAVYALTDTELDQVAMYQSFYTDLIFYAGAYSTNSNPQVDNIMAAGTRYQYGTGYPKRASLLHMDKTGHGWNASSNGQLSVLLHEFGHRWLYSFTIREGVSNTFSLNPDGAHPKRGVHLPAAFNVITATDASTMGGGYFTQTGALTYQTAPQASYYGYTWHELYLMGLAASAEMTAPWFYLNAAALEGAYYPASNTTYTVTSRVDVNPSQITDSMGLRNPSYATSQKAFTMAFVLLERAGSPVSSPEAAAFTADYAKRFRSHFAAVTANRGSVTIAPASMVPEADFVFSPASPTPGSVVSFTDQSYGEPTSWSWAFGDGGTSTSQNPSHTFAAAGSYSVALTAGKTSGSSSVTKIVVVTTAPGVPTNVVATATGLTSVAVTWSPAPGSTFEVVRVAPGGVSLSLGTTTSATLNDNSASAGTAYLYKVRTTAPIVTAFSTPDLATTFAFTDPTLTPASTSIRALHFNELRTAIQAVRTLAGQGTQSWGEAIVDGSTVVRSTHLTELRSVLDSARLTLVLPPLTYQYSGASGTQIRAGDINELRDGVK